MSLCYIAYLAMALYGLTHIDKGLRLSRLTLDASYANRYYKMNTRNFRAYGPPIEVVTRGCNNTRLYVLFCYSAGSTVICGVLREGAGSYILLFHLILRSCDYNMHAEGLLPADLH